jgi:hypothetical protein
MEYKVHEITTYNYSFDAGRGGPGELQLRNDERMVAKIKFIDDHELVPDPVLAADWNSATLFFRYAELPGLVHKLRNESRLGLLITLDGSVTITKMQGAVDSLVVCASCNNHLLQAKTLGIQEAMRRTVAFCGADILPMYCPVTFHLDANGYCAPYTSGATGYASVDGSGLGHLCLYDVEKENRSLPFTPENAEKIEDQLLAVHEMMHIWFRGRQNNYLIQEPFCKMVSFIISEASFGPDYCNYFNNTPDDHPNVLMKYLCQMGLNDQKTGELLQQLAMVAGSLGRALSDEEFADLVTDVLGQNAIPAFESSGILP